MWLNESNGGGGGIEMAFICNAEPQKNNNKYFICFFLSKYFSPVENDAKQRAKIQMESLPRPWLRTISLK